MVRPHTFARAAVCAFVYCIVFSAAGGAKEPQHRHVEASGSVRTYWFNRALQSVPNQTALNSALRLHFEWNAGNAGLGGSLTFVAVEPLGANGATLPRIDSSLPAIAYTTVSEANIRYALTRAAFVVGRQTLNTPWANPADTRLVPVTFSGLSAGGTLGAHLRWFAARITAWHPRTQGNFTASNLLTSQSTPGFGVVGLTYLSPRLTAGLWRYAFYNVSDQSYVELSERLGASSRALLVSEQYNSQRSSGTQLAGKIFSDVWGIRLAGNVWGTDIALSYDRGQLAAGAYHDGGPAALYTYSSDPLYTTSMVTGLYALRVGWSYKVGLSRSFAGDRLRLQLSRAGYFTMDPAQHTIEDDADIAYRLTPRLSVRERTGFVYSGAPPLTQFASRLQFEYGFGAAPER